MIRETWEEESMEMALALLRIRIVVLVQRVMRIDWEI